jgi:ABC-type Fe3+-hydroxamate transport system substrate-binding protein
MQDDTGAIVELPGQVSRVVSLVPSLTETLAETDRSLLVGATDWCAHPADLDVTRVRGTKNPDVEAVLALHPDLIVANQEENRKPDLDALRAAGLPVYVTDIRTVPQSFGSLTRMLAACGLPVPTWLLDAQAEWQDAELPGPEAPSAVIPIWRRPWMAVGSHTFTGDLVGRLGYRNVLDGSPERYPRFEPSSVAADLVIFPDEPYAFTPDDGPEAFPGTPFTCVDGRSLTWYGPSLRGARTRLRAATACHHSR